MVKVISILIRNMTEKQYITKRQELVNSALVISKRFFPRCVKARLKCVAHLDAEYNSSDWEDEYKRLLSVFELKR